MHGKLNHSEDKQKRVKKSPRPHRLPLERPWKMTCAYMLLKCLTNLEVVQCPIEEITTSYDSSMIEDISLNIEIN